MPYSSVCVVDSLKRRIATYAPVARAYAHTIIVSPVPFTCAQLDNDPQFCPPCEEAEEDPDTVNMTACENIEPNDLVHIEDVSRKTTIGEILNIVTKRIHYLGFPKMDLNMGLLHPTSQLPAAEDGDLSTSLPQDELPHQVPSTQNCSCSHSVH